MNQHEAKCSSSRINGPAWIQWRVFLERLLGPPHPTWTELACVHTLTWTLPWGGARARTLCMCVSVGECVLVTFSCSFIAPRWQLSIWQRQWVFLERNSNVILPRMYRLYIHLDLQSRKEKTKSRKSCCYYYWLRKRKTRSMPKRFLT